MIATLLQIMTEKQLSGLDTHTLNGLLHFTTRRIEEECLEKLTIKRFVFGL